ncbi:MAG: hypothetical protein OEX00_02675 [Gammaproteobacteria bacterium]|nr:hypothetical protein [Gammaproteobacteria bacterium]MDH5694553.1 hypothetical protein [Gammaproteobacteria bacterium]
MVYFFAIATFIALVLIAGKWRDHKLYYAAVLVGIALFYLAFAAIEPSLELFLKEAGFVAIFSLIAIFGRRHSLQLIALGIFTHGLFDFYHDMFFVNPGVPSWWPVYCAVVDILLGLWIAAEFFRTKAIRT